MGLGRANGHCLVQPELAHDLPGSTKTAARRGNRVHNYANDHHDSEPLQGSYGAKVTLSSRSDVRGGP